MNPAANCSGICGVADRFQDRNLLY